MEHYHDERAQTDARGSLLDDGQPQGSSPPTTLAFAPDAALNDEVRPNMTRNADDDLPALGPGVALPLRPPPHLHLPHGSPTRRRSRVANTREIMPLSITMTVWVSPESYRLGALARGTGVSPHASSEPGDDESASAAQPGDVVLTVELDEDSPGASIVGDDPVGVVPWEDDPVSLLVESLECVNADCLHRFDALENDGSALCYICQDSLLQHPSPPNSPSGSEHPNLAADHNSLNSARGGCSPPSVRAFPCRHLFHEACLIPWLHAHTTCPTCRFNAAPPGVQNHARADASENATEVDGSFNSLTRDLQDMELTSLNDASEQGASLPESLADSTYDSESDPAEQRGRTRQAHPITFDPDWRFPQRSSRPQTPLNAAHTLPALPAVLPHITHEARTPQHLPTFELQLDDQDTQLLEGMSALYQSSSSPISLNPALSHIVNVPFDGETMERLNQESIFLPPTQFVIDGELTTRDMHELELPDLLSSPSAVFSFPPDAAAIASDYGFRRMSLAMPALESTRQTDRRASMPIVAIQPDKAFSDWLADRESELNKHRPS